MSISPQTFVAPALGMVPDIGPFLVAGFNAETAGPSNQQIIDSIEEISRAVQYLDSELESFAAESELQRLYEAINDAPGNINTFYSPKNHPSVEKWIMDTLNGESKAHLTTYTAQEIKQWLVGIDGAMMGTQNPYPSWIRLLIEYYLAKYNPESENVNLTHSLLEKTYRSFLWMTQIQLKGLLCLRAVGESPEVLAKQAYMLLKNLINQGIHCQSVVNEYINGDQKQEFVWIQYNNASPSPGRNIDFSNANTLMWQGKVSGLGALCGVEFHTGTDPSNQQATGIRVANGSMDKHGRITDQGWNDFGTSGSAEFVSGGTTTTLPKASQNIVAGPGQVLTGVDFIFKVGDGNNVMAMNADSATQDGAGNYRSTGTIKQTIDAGTTNGTNFHHLGLNQMSSNNLFTDSPITGLFYNGTGGNQIVFGMATSLHQNAFTPYKIGDAPRVDLKSMNHGTLLDGDIASKSVSLQHGPVAHRLLLGKDYSGDYIYGKPVTITCVGTNESLYLTGNHEPDPGPTRPAQYVNLAPSGAGPLQWWELVDPNDVTNSGEPIYNWSAVAIKNSATGAYLWAKDIHTLMHPSTVGGMVRNCITDPDFVWNFPLLG